MEYLCRKADKQFKTYLMSVKILHLKYKKTNVASIFENKNHEEMKFFIRTNMKFFIENMVENYCYIIFIKVPDVIEFSYCTTTKKWIGNINLIKEFERNKVISQLKTIKWN